MQIDTSLEIDEKLKKTMLPLGVAVIIIVLSLVFVKPFIEKSIKLSQENKTNKRKLALLLEKANKLEGLNEAELQEKVNLVERVLPSKKPVLLFIDSLKLLADEQEVLIGGVTLNPGQIYAEEKEQKNVESMQIAFQVTGELDKISQFLDSLEQRGPVMRVESFGLKIPDLESGQQDSKQDQEGVESTLNVKVFYQYLPESMGKVSDPLHLLSAEEKKILEEIEKFEVIKVEQDEQLLTPVGKENPFEFGEDKD
jgi:hypothetical protein